MNYNIFNNINKIDILEKIVNEKGIDIINKKDDLGYNNTPLITACGNKAPIEIVEYLVKNGAEINARNKINQTALMYASRFSTFPVVKFLVENDAEINVRDNQNKTPLMYACSENNFEIIKFLVENGADVNSKDIFGNTPLQISCKTTTSLLKTKSVEYLVEKVSNVDEPDKNGTTPLMTSCIENDLEIVKILCEKGNARLYEIDEVGNTPLMYACKYSDISIVKYLINEQDASIYINHKNNRGETALDKACSNDFKYRKEIAFLLIINGADINLVNISLGDCFDMTFNDLIYLNDEKDRLDYMNLQRKELRKPAKKEKESDFGVKYKSKSKKYKFKSKKNSRKKSKSKKYKSKNFFL